LLSYRILEIDWVERAGNSNLSILQMKLRDQTFSSGDRAQQISAELAGLFQQQTAMMKREALVGLTPAEWEEYDNIVKGIRASYIELARLQSHL
jgi:hypothetical protein